MTNITYRNGVRFLFEANLLESKAETKARNKALFARLGVNRTRIGAKKGNKAKREKPAPVRRAETDNPTGQITADGRDSYLKNKSTWGSDTPRTADKARSIIKDEEKEDRREAAEAASQQAAATGRTIVRQRQQEDD
jgi:hypothetical protein